MGDEGVRWSDDMLFPSVKRGLGGESERQLESHVHELQSERCIASKHIQHL